MAFKIKSKSYSFGVLLTILTGKICCEGREVDDFACFVAGDSIGQVMVDRKSKWIPWILVQHNYLRTISIPKPGDAEFKKWYDDVMSTYGGNGREYNITSFVMEEI